MTDYELPQEPILFRDDEKGLFDPTGSIQETPNDQTLLSWLKTAYLVDAALKEHPDNQSLDASQAVIHEAIVRRYQDLLLQQRRQWLKSPQS